VPVGIVVDSGGGALRIAEKIENFGGYSTSKRPREAVATHWG
jgi:hypothetical protein